jgi:hypothetical protein
LFDGKEVNLRWVPKGDNLERLWLSALPKSVEGKEEMIHDQPSKYFMDLPQGGIRL